MSYSSPIVPEIASSSAQPSERVAASEKTKAAVSKALEREAASFSDVIDTHVFSDQQAETEREAWKRDGIGEFSHLLRFACAAGLLVSSAYAWVLGAPLAVVATLDALIIALLAAFAVPSIRSVSSAEIGTVSTPLLVYHQAEQLAIGHQGFAYVSDRDRLPVYVHFDLLLGADAVERENSLVLRFSNNGRQHVITMRYPAKAAGYGCFLGGSSIDHIAQMMRERSSAGRWASRLRFRP